VVAASAWAHALAVWVPGVAAPLLAAGLWGAGQLALGLPWRAWLPPASSVLGPSLAETLRVGLLVAAIGAIALAGIERRRA
jgi:hypothetical protein